MLRLRGTFAALLILGAWTAGSVHAQVRLRTETDRAALRSWFLLLADAQFYRPTPDVIDCAGLIRHALREALRPHTPDWVRRARLPVADLAPDIIERPAVRGDAVPLFVVGANPARHAEFADARTIITLNSTRVGRDVGALRPGDLLYFHQAGQASPDHVMVFLGPTVTDRARQDWVVYHTGPDGTSPGEVRKVSLADLQRHPASRWRPIPGNAAFIGVFRLHALQ